MPGWLRQTGVFCYDFGSKQGKEVIGLTIGQRIAQLRKQFNLSQEALGEELGVSRQAISKWESDAALPEIDKLVALSRRFDVTVGYLLGVEEEKREGEAEESGPTEAQVLENYLKSLPRRKPVSRKKRFFAAVLVGICLFVAVDYVFKLENRIDHLNNMVSQISSQLSGVRNELYGISGDISNQINDALNQEYGLLAKWDLKLKHLNYKQGTATVELNAVLKQSYDTGAGMRFYAQLEDGAYVEAEEQGVWDIATNSFCAKIVLPIDASGVTYLLTTPEGTVCLAENYDHELCELSDGTRFQVWASFSGIYPDLWMSLDVALPWMATKENSGLDFSLEPEVRVWLTVNGQRLVQLECEARNADPGSSRWYEYHISAKELLPNYQPAAGDRITAEYEVVYGDNVVAGDDADEILVYQGNNNWIMEVHTSG